MTEPGASGMRRIDAAIEQAVRQVACADPDPMDPYRGLYMTDASALGTSESLDGTGLEERLSRAVAGLGLSNPLDGALLGLCAAPVLDARYGRLFGYLHDDLTRRRPSPRLLARLLADQASEAAVLSRLARTAPLRHEGAIAMLEDDASTPAIDRMLVLDGRLETFLLGCELGADELADRLVEVSPDATPARDARTIEGVRRRILASKGLPVLLAGPDAKQVAAQALGQSLMVLEAADMGDERLLAGARLRARLVGARLALAGLDELSAEQRKRFRARLETLEDPPLLLAERAQALPALVGLAHLGIVVEPPSEAERARVWGAQLGRAERSDVVCAFPLGSEQIAQAARIATAQAHGMGRREPDEADLAHGARQTARRGIQEHATLLAGGFAWEDLVLAEHELAQLRSIASRLRHRTLVLERWGFAERIACAPGLKILFTGESGTGKTTACQVIANDLGLDLYRIDLARTVSKFIGETEKSLARIFDAAEDAGAVIFFDEADALFGKRSAVGDAHDRYANMEVAYLLQRIERFAGAVVLATNLRHNLDQAFLRRLDFLVDFPLPDRTLRRRLWERHIPGAAPIAADVDLDELAEHSLPGGSIRNCMLHAAFAAADDGLEISSAHLRRAVRLEQRKLGRLAVGDIDDGHPA